MSRFSNILYSFVVILLCISLHTASFGAVPTDEDAKAFAEDCATLLNRSKSINIKNDDLYARMKINAKGKAKVIKEFIFIINTMQVLKHIELSLSQCVAIYKREKVTKLISIENSTDLISSPYINEVKNILTRAEMPLQEAIQRSNEYNLTLYNKDIKDILTELQEIYKLFPAANLRKFDTAPTGTEHYLLQQYNGLIAQTISFLDTLSKQTATVEDYMEHNASQSNIFSLLVLHLRYEYIFTILYTCFECAAICHLTHTHPSISGFNTAEANALKNLATCVQSLTKLKEFIHSQARDNTPWLQPADAEHYTRALDAWRKALVEALASDGLTLPEVADK